MIQVGCKGHAALRVTTENTARAMGSGELPVLAISGEHDPVTPPRYGDEAIAQLGNARHLVLKGQGHNVIGAGCMPKLFTQFIEKADAKALDGKCLDKLGYAVPFTSFNGAEP